MSLWICAITAEVLFDLEDHRSLLRFLNDIKRIGVLHVPKELSSIETFAKIKDQNVRRVWTEFLRQSQTGGKNFIRYMPPPDTIERHQFEYFPENDLIIQTQATSVLLSASYLEQIKIGMLDAGLFADSEVPEEVRIGDVTASDFLSYEQLESRNEAIERSVHLAEGWLKKPIEEIWDEYLAPIFANASKVDIVDRHYLSQACIGKSGPEWLLNKLCSISNIQELNVYCSYPTKKGGEPENYEESVLPAAKRILPRFVLSNRASKNTPDLNPLSGSFYMSFTPFKSSFKSSRIYTKRHVIQLDHSIESFNSNICEIDQISGSFRELRPGDTQAVNQLKADIKKFDFSDYSHVLNFEDLRE